MAGDRERLLALAEQVADSDGPDAALNVAIACALPLRGYEERRRPSRVAGRVVSTYEDGRTGTWIARNFTGSIEAVRRRMPDDHAWSVGTLGEDNRPWACVTQHEPPCTDYAGSAATPELALCAAWLRALAGPAPVAVDGHSA